MKISQLSLFGGLTAALLLSGCGGQTGGTANNPRNATLTGQVLFLDGAGVTQPVRGARIRVDGRETTSSNAGSYSIDSLTSGFHKVEATISANGLNYRGSTMVITVNGSVRSNGNILLAPTGNLGRIEGVVRDRSGFLLEGVNVFAYNGAGSSARAITNEDGVYAFTDLIGGELYEVVAMSQGYRADWDDIRVVRNDTIFTDFILGNPGTPTLTAPQNFGVVTWVSPIQSRASNGSGSALAWAKANAFKSDKKLSLKAQTATSRAAVGDTLVEAVLSWDEQRFDDHLGWGIYRGSGETGTLRGLEFNADPLAAFFQDQGLNTRSTYRYAATTLSSRYDDLPDLTESNLSAIDFADTLGPFGSSSVSGAPLRFNWTTSSGATDFKVYVFAEYPRLDVNSIAESAIITGTSVNYSSFGGPTLNSGRTYYYFILGLANGNASRTISEVRTFIP